MIFIEFTNTNLQPQYLHHHNNNNYTLTYHRFNSALGHDDTHGDTDYFILYLYLARSGLDGAVISMATKYQHLIHAIHTATIW